MLTEYNDFAVVPDLHGRPELLEAVMRHYAHLILAGDLVDGPDSKGVLELASAMTTRSITVLGNHDYVLDAAMHEQDPDARDVWSQVWARPYHDRVLASYGIPNVVSAESAAILNEAMPLHHQDVLKYAVPYVQGPGFMIVHAGITGQKWEVQRSELDMANSKRVSGDFGWSIPLQICGVYRRDAAHDEPEYVLSPTSAVEVLDQAKINTMITGHWHLNNGQHRKAGGRVIHLAANKTRNEIPIYEVWSDKVKIIEPVVSVSVPDTYAAVV